MFGSRYRFVFTLLLAVAFVPMVAADESKFKALSSLYRLAATVEICGLNLPANEEERLQEALDEAEQASGLNEEQRESVYSKILADMRADKKKSCSELASDTMILIRQLPK